MINLRGDPEKKNIIYEIFKDAAIKWIFYGVLYSLKFPLILLGI